MAALEMNATKIPNTMLNWNNPVKRPRNSAGAISAMYSGAAMVDAPTPNPPRKRAIMKIETSGASADAKAEIKYKTPMPIKVLRRP